MPLEGWGIGIAAVVAIGIGLCGLALQSPAAVLRLLPGWMVGGGFAAGVLFAFGLGYAAGKDRLLGLSPIDPLFALVMVLGLAGSALIASSIAQVQIAERRKHDREPQ